MATKTKPRKKKALKEEEPKLEPVKSGEPSKDEEVKEEKEPVEESKLEPKEEEPKLEQPASEPVAPEDPDYLRQYQYKSVDNQPTTGGVKTDPDPGSKAATMKKSLLSQQRVSIFVPRSESEDPKIKLSVNLNGYRLDLPKNVYLEVPLQVAEVIRESLNQQASALLPFQVNKRTEKALS